MSRELIRTDKNGTQYFHCIDACAKCNGNGYIKMYAWNENGVCFDCGGTGIWEHTEKEYTSEYLVILEQRRLRKAERDKAKNNAEFFKKQGISEDGNAWMVLGNTYEIKEQIKEAGGKYNEYIGWHFDHEVSEFDTVKLTASEMFSDNYAGYFWKTDTSVYNTETMRYESTDEETIYQLVDRLRSEYRNSKASESEEPTSEYVAEVGDKYDSVLTLNAEYSFDSAFGTMNIYKFLDENSNVIVWKTSKGLAQMVDTSKPVRVKGTVKELKEYRGVKQTVLTRCKVSAVA